MSIWRINLEIISQFGVAHPWLCDSLGHMNTRHYHGMFDDALFVLLARLGVHVGAGRSSGIVFVDVRNELDYTAEVHAGDVVIIRAHLEQIGNKSITAILSMTSIDAVRSHAAMKAVLVCMEVKSRKAVSLPDIVRLEAQRYLAKVVPS